MSILLDALKKSETLRQLGKTPTIHTMVEAPDAERESEQQWIFLSMLAISAVAIAWFGWQQFRQPVTTPHEAGEDVVAMLQVAESPVVESQVPAEKKQRGGTNPAPAAASGKVEKDLAGSAIVPANGLEESQQRREKLGRSFSSYVAEKDAASDMQAESSSPVIAQTESPAETNQSRLTEKTKEATSPGRSIGLQIHEAEPISYWQIPQSLRDSLPEFRINVLVYAEKPEDRFLLINGQRLVEKEEFASGVVLDEIRRDGAVFRYRNYRFLVKG